MAPHGFERQYRDAFAALGEPLSEDDRIPSDELCDRVPEGVTLPDAVAAYYAVAGRSPLNQRHNVVRPLELLEPDGRRLCFMDENQNACVWAFERDSIENPSVWQGQLKDDGSVDWYPEGQRFAEFIIAMLTWTVTGEQPQRP